jgi:restriction endonuclease Mrr
MQRDERDRLVRAIGEVSARWQDMDWQEFDDTIAGILEPALTACGYVLRERRRGGEQDDGFDVFGVRAPDAESGDLVIGAVSKKYKTPISVANVRELIGAASIARCDRAMMVAPSGFSRSSIETATMFDPVAIELMDLERLRAWVESLPEEERDDTDAFYLTAVADFCRRLAGRVATDPGLLDRMEWRPLELMLGEVLREIGFDVEVTRCSRDGGKDLIVWIEARGMDKTFYIEVKHWQEPSRPGKDEVRDFIKVLIKDKVDQGIMLSSSGFALNAFEGLTEISKRRIRIAGRAKVLSLCRTYVRARSGLWSPKTTLEDLLLEETFEVKDALSARR